MAMTPTGWDPNRPWNAPGVNRNNAISKPADPGFVARISGAVRSWLGMQEGPGSPQLPFFPPGQPLDPVAQGAWGRRFDYPTNYNISIRPRSYEAIDFDTLRAVADPSVGGWDLIRLAIETRKDQFSKLQFNVLPRKPPNVQLRPKADSRCTQIEEFLRRPDGDHSWTDWVRMLLEEHLVIDAATIVKRPTLSGKVGRLEIISGDTIRPILNYDGRKPETGPCYSQVLKGLPAVDYSRDEIIYAPRNPRVHKVYGYSCVEQVIVTVNIGLRRQVSQLGYFTEGNVPDVIFGTPPDWTTQRVAEFQDYWDTMVNDAVRRRKARFVPGGIQPFPTRNDQYLVDQFDEWLARVVQYCFSLPPTPLVRMMNRATAENSYEQSLDEGLQPLMMWIKNIIDDVISRWFGYPDLEMVYDDVKKTDPAEREARDLALVPQGIISRDDMRAERGMDPLGLPPIINGIGPLGFMSVDAVKKVIKAGWDITGMPQPGLGVGPGGELGPQADPSQLGTGSDADPLSGLPPEVLEALGVAPPQDGAQPGGKSIVPGNEPLAGGQRDPTGNGLTLPTAQGGGKVVPIHKHPGFLAALQEGDKAARRAAASMQR